MQRVLCLECCLQSQTGSVQDKSYWKIILMASDTSRSVWGDRNDFGHWNKHFFSLCNIIYYSQHIINLKACFNTGRCAIALHQERFLTLKRSPLLLPCLKEKVDRAAFFVSLQPIISRKPVERRSISFLSSPFLHLFSIWTVLGTWITQRDLGWGRKHPAVELPQTKSCIYSHHRCRVHTTTCPPKRN